VGTIEGALGTCYENLKYKGRYINFSGVRRAGNSRKSEQIEPIGPGI